MGEAGLEPPREPFPGARRGRAGRRLDVPEPPPRDAVPGPEAVLAREMVGRRINTAIPADSTLLEKSIGSVQHSGGKRFEADGDLYRTVHEWITVGANNDDVSKLPKVVGVEIYPKAGVLDGKGATQQK